MQRHLARLSREVADLRQKAKEAQRSTRLAEQRAQHAFARALSIAFCSRSHEKATLAFMPPMALSFAKSLAMRAIPSGTWDLSWCCSVQ